MPLRSYWLRNSQPQHWLSHVCFKHSFSFSSAYQTLHIAYAGRKAVTLMELIMGELFETRVWPVYVCLQSACWECSPSPCHGSLICSLSGCLTNSLPYAFQAWAPLLFSSLFLSFWQIELPHKGECQKSIHVKWTNSSSELQGRETVESLCK